MPSPFSSLASSFSAHRFEFLWRTFHQMRAVGIQRLQWPALLGLLIVLVAATFYTVRLSSFMLDVTKADASVFPARQFFRAHSCLSAYTETAWIVFMNASRACT